MILFPNHRGVGHGQVQAGAEVNAERPADAQQRVAACRIIASLYTRFSQHPDITFSFYTEYMRRTKLFAEWLFPQPSLEMDLGMDLGADEDAPVVFHSTSVVCISCFRTIGKATCGVLAGSCIDCHRWIGPTLDHYSLHELSRILKLDWYSLQALFATTIEELRERTVPAASSSQAA